MKYPAYLFILPLLLALAGCPHSTIEHPGGTKQTKIDTAAVNDIIDKQARRMAELTVVAEHPDTTATMRAMAVAELDARYNMVTAMTDAAIDAVVNSARLYGTSATVHYTNNKWVLGFEDAYPDGIRAVPNQRELQEAIRAKDMELDAMRHRLDAVVSTHPKHRGDKE